MKTNPQNHMSAIQPTALLKGIKSLILMKQKLAAALIACLFATTGVFGATIIWDGGNGTGTALGAATNWVGDLSPNSGAGDIAQWDGTVPGNLFLTATSANGNFNNGTPGLSFYIAAGHTGSWNLTSLIAGGSGNIALDDITIENGAGAFSLGDGTANVLNVILRPSSSGAPFPVHSYTNNSATAATIFPNVRFQSGGGNPHTIQIDGTGDWIVNNALNNANAGNNNDFILKTGSGTMFWNANTIAAAAGVNGIGSPIDLEGGRVVLTASATELGTQRITNNATLQFDAPAAAQTLSGPMNGIGNVVVSAGTLTLSSSQSDWSGNIVLTNGGVLVVGGNQNVGGTGPLGTDAPTNTISFKGGTLQFSVANTFDYSPRFSTAANQAYSFNSGGQNVTFTNALTSSGGTLTKLGSGTLTLTGANTYSGTTAVGGGKLVLQGTAGTGAIIVSNSTALGVNQGGTQIAPSTLTVGTSSSATLEFNNVTSTVTPAITAGTLVAGGTITVNIGSGVFALGTPYPLLHWTLGTFTAGSFALGTVNGAGGSLSVSGNTLFFTPNALASKWTGNADAIWSATSGAIDWIAGGVPSQWINGAPALFDDTIANANTNITLGSSVIPNGVTVNNNTAPYSITSSAGNVISGSTGLSKSGNGSLELAGGVNTYTGPTTLNGGITSVGLLGNGGSPSDIGQSGNAAANLVLNGGTLLYTGGAQDSDRLITLGTGNGTINASSSGALNLTNSGTVALSGSGVRTLTLAGTSVDDNTLAARLGDNGGATALSKAGAGKWVVTGNNTNSGTVTIAAGTLQVGNGGASGALGSGNIVDNGTLIFNTTSTLTNGTITGTGMVTVDGGTVILPGNNTYSGATTINAGTLQVGNGGASGSLNNNANITDNGTFIYNSTLTTTINPAITGGGNVIVRKGTLQAIGNNSYTGWTQIDPGTTFQPSLGNVGLLASSVVTNNGTLLLGRQDNAVFIYSGNIVGSGSVQKVANNGNNGDVTLNGTNTYTGGTYILGGTIIFGDNSNPGFGSFVGNVFLTNDYAHNQFGGPPNDFVPAILIFNRPDDFIFPGNIVGEGFVTLNGSGMVTLTGNNTYTNRGTGDTTTISAGTLQVGNGGTSGSIGSGRVTLTSILSFNRSDSLTVPGAISGAGLLNQYGSGITSLNGNSPAFTGGIVVTNGSLFVNNTNGTSLGQIDGGSFGGSGTLAGPVSVAIAEGATLRPGASASVGVFTINGDLTINGNVAIDLNKSFAQSNDLVVVTGALNCSGTGTITVTNRGAIALKVGDKFTLFTTADGTPIAVPNGASLTIVSGAGTFVNTLATDGTITVATVSPVIPQPTLNSGLVNLGGTNNIQFSWTGNFKLQSQTNSLSVGIGTNWSDYPGGGTSPVTVPIIRTNGVAFQPNADVMFRLATP